jgi:hypothetical protein
VHSRGRGTTRWLPGKAWLPVSFHLQRHPIRVRWAEFGSTPLSHPFFHQSLDYVRGALEKTIEFDTDVRTLMESVRDLAPVAPAGMILHISRCGSTWISNCLRTAKDTTVVSEANPIQQLLDQTFVPSNCGYDEAVRRQILACLLTRLAHHRSAKPDKIVLKLDVLGLFLLPRLRAYWPDVPILILIRNPAEVIASNVARPGLWLTGRLPSIRNFIPYEWTGSNPSRMSAEEYCARTVGSLCEAATRGLDARCMVVSYEAIDQTVVGKIGAFFGLCLPDAHGEDLQRALRLDAKDRSGKRDFRDKPRGPAMLQESCIRSAAETWALEPYTRLRQFEELAPGKMASPRPSCLQK